MTHFAIGKEDRITHKFSPSTRETDMIVEHENETLIIRFLEPEAIVRLIETLKRMQGIYVRKG